MNDVSNQQKQQLQSINDLTNGLQYVRGQVDQMVNQDEERESALKSHEMNIDNVTDKILLLQNRFNEEMSKSARSGTKININSANLDEVEERL